MKDSREDRRIEYTSVSPLEIGSDVIELTDEIKRFLELKYASVIFGSSSPKENKDVEEALSGVFTNAEQEELIELEKSFSRRGFTYGKLVAVINKKYPDYVKQIEQTLIEKRNNILNKKNIFKF